MHSNPRLSQHKIGNYHEETNFSRKFGGTRTNRLCTNCAIALHELGACIEQSEYGANFSTNDFEAALTLAEAEAARAEHEANGLVSMF